MDIQLQLLQNGTMKRSEFKNELRKQLPKEAYFFTSPYSIAFAALMLIKDLKVRRSFKSIDENAKKVLEEFYTSVSEPDGKFAHLFIINILELYGDLPIIYKQQLERVAKRDLSNLDNLLNHYNSLDFIESNRTRNSTPRDHAQKTILEFYTRTLKKRTDLVDYVLFKLDDRAIEKSGERENRKRVAAKKKERPSNFDKDRKEYVTSKDFPYRDMVIDYGKMDFKYILNFERLDYRKINVVINKSLAVRINCDPSKGYSKQFYRSINQIKETSIFKHLIQEVKDTPLLKNRSSIFRELCSLYNKKHWYGFYALALPQVEGIFAEMVKASNPSGKVTGALTDKVQQIRPFYENSEYLFDYYEFYLPNERNSFSHTGNVSDVRRKCKILLLDLLAVVKIFGELDSAVIRARNILGLGPKYVTDIGKLSNLLYLIEKTRKDKLYDDIRPGCEKFVYTDLSKEIDFTSFIRNLEVDFARQFEQYRERIHLFSGAFDDERQVDVRSLRGKNFAANLERIQQVHDTHSFMFGDNLKLLLDTHYVITNFVELFPKLDESIKAAIDAFAEKNMAEMKIIKILNDKLRVEIPEDFMLLQKDLKHYLRNDP